MKKNKSLVGLMTFVLLVFVLSCNEQEETPKMQNETTTIPAVSKVRNVTGRIGTIDFNGLEGDPLDMGTAQKWAANFRSTSEKPDEILSHYFGFEIIQSILKQPSCVGIRIYYAIDDTGEKKLILIGVDATGENLLPVAGGKTSEVANIIADFSFPCPSYCPGNGL